MITDPALWIPMQAAATLFMTGLIWFVQVVHYPLMAHVGERQAAAYAAKHSSLTTLVVAPPMLVELAAATLLIWRLPEGVSFELAAAGFGLAFLIWIVTAAFSIPCHSALQQGFDPRVHRRLVRTNWIRTLAWTGRALIVLLMLYGFLETNHA